MSNAMRLKTNAVLKHPDAWDIYHGFGWRRMTRRGVIVELQLLGYHRLEDHDDATLLEFLQSQCLELEEAKLFLAKAREVQAYAKKLEMLLEAACEAWRDVDKASVEACLTEASAHEGVMTRELRSQLLERASVEVYLGPLGTELETAEEYADWCAYVEERLGGLMKHAVKVTAAPFAQLSRDAVYADSDDVERDTREMLSQLWNDWNLELGLGTR